MASSSAEGVRTAPALKMTRTTLLVGNLPPGATCDELEANLVMAFSPFGEVVECEVIEDAQGGARGFAFLRMRDSRQARAAKHDLDGTYLTPNDDEDQLPIRVRWSLDTHTLCVSDLGPYVTSQHLRDAFEQFGNVVSCRVAYENAESSYHTKYHGFVEFSQRSIAAKVQQLLSDNIFLMGNSARPVRVDFAVDDEFDDNEGAPVDPNFKPPPPHFAVPGSLEFDFALRWRELSLAHHVERERLDEVHRQEREVLRQEQCDIYKHEHEKFQFLDNPASGVQPDMPAYKDGKRPRREP